MLMQIKYYSKYLWIRIVIALLIALAFTACVRVSYNAFIWHSNISQFNNLTSLAIDRVNKSSDLVLEKLRSLHLAGISRCDQRAVQKIRQTSFLSGYIKDILVLDENDNILCSGSQQVEFLEGSNFYFDSPYLAVAPRTYFLDIMQNNAGLLGVARKITENRTFVAVLNINALLRDIAPSEISSFIRVDIVLGGDREVASIIPQRIRGINTTDFNEFIHSSDRYPLEVRVTVSDEALLIWNSASKTFVFDLSLVIGLLLGWMALVYLGRSLSMVDEMKLALQRGEFVPFMQPIFNIQTGKIVGCEVLMRWQKPDGKILSPFEFISIAESSGMIVLMTRAIMCDTLIKLQPQLLKDKQFKVAFNIVPSDLISNLFEFSIMSMIRDTGILPSQIVLEITERQSFSDQAQAIEVIKSLQKRGFQVALDDTGAGHNGLTNVQRLGANILKIDKIFVDRVDVDNSARTIVQMLVRLAHEMDMRTVAEGIETKEQLQALASCSVDEGQGYLVSKPLAFDAFVAFVYEQEVLQKSQSTGKNVSLLKASA